MRNFDLGPICYHRFTYAPKSWVLWIGPWVLQRDEGEFTFYREDKGVFGGEEDSPLAEADSGTDSA